MPSRQIRFCFGVRSARHAPSAHAGHHIHSAAALASPSFDFEENFHFRQQRSGSVSSFIARLHALRIMTCLQGVDIFRQSTLPTARGVATRAFAHCWDARDCKAYRRLAIGKRHQRACQGKMPDANSRLRTSRPAGVILSSITLMPIMAPHLPYEGKRPAPRRQRDEK